MAKFNVNSNAYIIIYSVVMVVVVAVLLAVTSLSLQERQQANMLNEKQQQIVKALGENPETSSYGDVVAQAVMLDKNGKAIEGKSESDIFASLSDLTASFEAGEFPIFKAKNGCVVIPVYGAGLWGPIWGYVSLNDDKATVYGAYFAHAGETPGLGADIALPKFQNQFPGKKISREGEFTSIAIVKPGKTDDTKDYVNGISGGTITSQGVDAMLLEGLGQYVNFLKQ